MEPLKAVENSKLGISSCEFQADTWKRINGVSMEFQSNQVWKDLMKKDGGNDIIFLHNYIFVLGNLEDVFDQKLQKLSLTWLRELELALNLLNLRGSKIY